jgi:hypothetical protein
MNRRKATHKIERLVHKNDGQPAISDAGVAEKVVRPE